MSVRNNKLTLRHYRPGLLIGGCIVLVITAVIACGVGSVYIPPITIAKIIIQKLFGSESLPSWPASWDIIVWHIRFPRIILAGLVGASLSMSGATFQSVFRNPLADPYLIGVASGSGLGATIILLTNVPVYMLGISVLPFAAFLGGLSAVSVSYLIAKRSGTLSLPILILAGVAVASLAGSATSFLMLRSDPDIRPLLGWLLGGFVGASWLQVLTVLPYVFVGAIIMLAYGRILNIFQTTEQEASQLGVNVEKTKILLICCASLTTAAAVSVSGLIGFIGLISPHIVRLIWGHDYRFLIPMAMIVGAVSLVISDMLARIVLTPSEIPVGIVTACYGVPFFLYLLQRKQRSL